MAFQFPSFMAFVFSEESPNFITYKLFVTLRGLDFWRFWRLLIGPFVH